MRRFAIITLAVMLIAALMPVSSYAEGARRVVPGGQSIGVIVQTEGLIVIGLSDIGNNPSPARLAGIRRGDVVTKINGRDITGVTMFTENVTNSDARITYERNGVSRDVSVAPALDISDGKYKLGLWVRDSAAGIGTLTFYDGENGAFGALGHAVTDSDAGIVLPIGGGAIYENSIVDIERGKVGRPGEIMGQFADGGFIGDVHVNAEQGVFGLSKTDIVNPLFPNGVEIAEKDDIRTGTAKIVTTLDDDGIKEYSCLIDGINDGSSPITQGFSIVVTDSDMLEKTGGIVQGMSGSPVIQNGKLVGAVTHVLVNDPTRGYGVSIEDMLTVTDKAA